MQVGLFSFLGAWPRVGGQVSVEGLFGCEPVSAELPALDQSSGQKVADVASRIACILRRLPDRDPLRQGILPKASSKSRLLLYYDLASLAIATTTLQDACRAEFAEFCSISGHKRAQKGPGKIVERVALRTHQRMIS